MNLTANWSYPTAIRFGAGRISEIAEACGAAGIAKPLLVTDRGLAGLQITHQTLDLMENAGLGRAMFAEVDPNPNEENLAAGIDAFKAGGHDGVIAFGGGSGLDLAKMVAFMADQTRPVWDFEDIGDWWTRADADAIHPIVAVPDHRRNRLGGGTRQRADECADPCEEDHLPPQGAALGRDLRPGTDRRHAARDHGGHRHGRLRTLPRGLLLPALPPDEPGDRARGYAPGQGIPAARIPQPDDLEARAQMMSAALMGATAFQKGLGAIHAVSHPIGALYNTHHGTTNAVVMQDVLRFNRAAIEDRLALAGGYLGIAGGFDAFCDFVGALNAQLGIPASLKAMGIDAPDIDAILEGAVTDPSCGGNPVPLDKTNLRALIESLF